MCVKNQLLEMLSPLVDITGTGTITLSVFLEIFISNVY